MPKRINFVTTNSYKFEIAQQFFKSLPSDRFTLAQYDIETPEIQDSSEEKIAEHSAMWVSRQLGELAIVSDVGFHIDSLGGFPGPFVKYANEWFQPQDILKMMQGNSDRSAYFVDVLAIAAPDGVHKSFTTITQGTIVDESEIPDIKWTMNALFVPDGHTKTLAEMDDKEEDAVWSNDGWHQLIQYLVESSDND